MWRIPFVGFGLFAAVGGGYILSLLPRMVERHITWAGLVSVLVIGGGSVVGGLLFVVAAAGKGPRISL
jgi:hypothetical protein